MPAPSPPSHTRVGPALPIAALGVCIVAGLCAARAIRRAMARPHQFEGRTVFITGGSRGLGFVLAREFLRRGARVAICARDQVELARARTRLTDTRRPGGARPGENDIFAVVCDVTDRSAVERTIRTIEQRLCRGRAIDILINNAGIITLAPMEDMSNEDYEHAMKVHFWGPLYTTLAALPAMKAQARARRPGEGAPRIINIASIGGKIGVPHLGPYSASKFALKGFSESLAAELHADGIAITTVCPGIMRTGGHLNSTYKGRHEHEYAWMNSFNLIPGMSVSAEHAARTIADAAAAPDPPAELVIGVAARAAAKVHGLAPAAFARFNALANRLLPRPGGIGQQHITGVEIDRAHRSAGARRGPLKALIYRTAARHNQFAALRATRAREHPIPSGVSDPIAPPH